MKTRSGLSYPYARQISVPYNDAQLQEKSFLLETLIPMPSPRLISPKVFILVNGNVNLQVPQVKILKSSLMHHFVPNLTICQQILFVLFLNMSIFQSLYYLLCYHLNQRHQLSSGLLNNLLVYFPGFAPVCCNVFTQCLE